jgi:hypothetical protein
MLVLRRRAAGLLLAGGIIGTGIAIDTPPGHAADTSLTVSPGRGSVDAQFTVTYRWPAARGRRHTSICVPDQVTFEWDGSPLGRAAATPAGSACVATLRTTPPQGALHGTDTYAISVTNDRSARATYTVTEGPAGTPSANPSSAAPDGLDPGADPQATDVAGEPSASAAPTAERAAGGSANLGAPGWLIAFGTVLFLVGAGMFGMIAWQSRRRRSDAEALRPLDTDAQSRALRGRTERRPAHRARRDG